MPRPYRHLVGDALAAAFLAADAWSREALIACGARALGEEPATAWLRKVATAVTKEFRAPPRQRIHALARFVANDARVREACAKGGAPRVRQMFVANAAMGRSPWPVPPLATTGELGAWLGLEPTALEWIADARGLERLVRDEALRHYTYRWVAKRRGGVRLLEAPKARTKAVQRRILREILDHVPLHDAAHGFRTGRSVASHAAPHAGRDVVMRVDLADFFLSIHAGRVRAVFKAIGYPEDVAFVLTALVTNRAPPRGPAEARAMLGVYASHAEIEAHRRAEQLARTPHLPQGAPTSPALANLVAFGLDVRLSAAANAVGAQYTRYADDLVFSGDEGFARRTRRFAALVAAIAEDEGFAVNHRKTRVMRKGGRQSVAGLVVNGRATIPRDRFDAIRAMVHNCATRGPASQNREGREDFRGYVEGVVAWVAGMDATKGEVLRQVLERVDWS